MSSRPFPTPLMTSVSSTTRRAATFRSCRRCWAMVKSSRGPSVQACQQVWPLIRRTEKSAVHQQKLSAAPCSRSREPTRAERSMLTSTSPSLTASLSWRTCQAMCTCSTTQASWTNFRSPPAALWCSGQFPQPCLPVLPLMSTPDVSAERRWKSRAKPRTPSRHPTTTDL